MSHRPEDQDFARWRGGIDVSTGHLEGALEHYLSEEARQFEKLALSVGAESCKGLTDADCPGGSVYKLQVLQGVGILVNGVTEMADLQEGSMLYHLLFQLMFKTTGDLEVSHETALGLAELVAEEVGDYMDTPDDLKDQFDWFKDSE